MTHLLGIHDRGAVFGELGALQWFTGEVSRHVIGWTILDAQVVLVDAICNEEVSNVEVPGSFGGAGGSVGFEQDGTSVVLVDSCFGSVTLCFQVIARPECGGHDVVCSNEL